MLRVKYIFILLLIIPSDISAQNIDSSAIQVFRRVDADYDSLTTFSYSKQYGTQNLLYTNAKPREYFVGFNFGFGTLFNSEIKSNYPGFIGFGLHSGIKFNTGFIIEAEWRYNQFQRNVDYSYNTQNQNNLFVYSVKEGSLSMNHFGVSVLYTDFRSPFIAFRYFYGGFGAGVANVSETRMLTTSNITNAESPITSDDTFSEWYPNLFFIFGMNFLYLPQSQNWFSIDLRFDYILKNTEKRYDSILGYQSQFTGINSTVRFYFDLTR